LVGFIGDCFFPSLPFNLFRGNLDNFYSSAANIVVHTIDTLFPVDAHTHTMTSILDSRPQAKGDPDRKSVHSSDDAVDSEASSMVFDGDGVRLLGGGAEGVQKYGLPESRKIGVAGAFFLILNKMIGTGSECFLVWYGG